MHTDFSHYNIDFSFEGVDIHASNLVFARFHNPVPAHSHGANCYEIHYISDGFGTLYTNHATYEIVPNTLYITGPGVEHAQTPDREHPMQEYCIYLSLDHTHKKSPQTPILNHFTDFPFWFGQDSQNSLLLIQDLFHELSRRHTGYLQKAELLLAQLLIHIVRNYEKSAPPLPKVTSDISSPNKTLLIEEYFLYEYQTLSLDELAKRLNLSPRQTQRLLLSYYGKTFSQKKTEAKMSAATFLLQDQTKSITLISELLGYSSPEYFTNTFKSYYQKSPRDYRKKYRNSN